MPILTIDYNLINHSLIDNKLVNDLQIRSDLQLKYANKGLVKQLMTDSKEKKESIEVIDGITDVIVNQYEGGFKVWEGLQDIIDYFIQYNVFNDYSNLKSLNVLELGCGSGLVSIFCSKKLMNANLYLQDFNEEVIKYFTAINVVLNNEMNSRFNYLFGDWSETVDDIHCLGLKFDLIFMTETLYNSDNYEKLVKVLKTGLSSSGTVYIGSKSHYFGVGGGTYSFMDFIETDGHFECEISHEIDSPLIRHILKLWPKK